MKGPKPKDPVLRFAPKVSHDEATGCWIWTGVKSTQGYGQFAMKVDGIWRPVAAHRWAFQRWNDVIPAGLDLDHLCRNRACVNPWHLEPVTRSENLLRGLGGRLRSASEPDRGRQREQSRIRTARYRAKQRDKVG